MKTYRRVGPGFAPLFDAHSRILILGSFPSVKSRESRFYYGNPQNRFWKVMAAVLQASVPLTIPEKTSLLLRHGIALWDVIDSCDIIGSSDSSIRNAVPADVPGLLQRTQIDSIFVNGGTAARLYHHMILPQTEMPATRLPSTSPANARMRLPDLVRVWGKALCEVL